VLEELPDSIDHETKVRMAKSSYKKVGRNHQLVRRRHVVVMSMGSLPRPTAKVVIDHSKLYPKY